MCCVYFLTWYGTVTALTWICLHCTCPLHIFCCFVTSIDSACLNNERNVFEIWIFYRSTVAIVNKICIEGLFINNYWRRFFVISGIIKVEVKAGFHIITDDRGSQIADRKMFCDRLRSYGNTLLRSSAILRSWSQTIAEDRTMFYLLRSSAINFDQLRSCDHMETKVLRSTIETYPIIFWIPIHDSTLLSNKETAYL